MWIGHHDKGPADPNGALAGERVTIDGRYPSEARVALAVAASAILTPRLVPARIARYDAGG
jgi:hypothetical protein